MKLFALLALVSAALAQTQDSITTVIPLQPLASLATDLPPTPCHYDPEQRISSDRVCKILMCVVKELLSGASTGGLWGCIAARNKGENNFLAFKVKSGPSVKETGYIMNAAVSWGKWQMNGEDVTTINNTEFDSKRVAEFTGMGREGSPSGVEGRFEIHIGRGVKVATVEFGVPFWGSNHFDLKHSNDAKYLCTHTQVGSGGSPTVEINCHKISE